MLALLALHGSSGCPAPSTASHARPQTAARPGRARAWTAADALFRRDPRWLGGDAAYSVPIDADRTLWLFGDSFIAERPPYHRAQAQMIRNSVAIQRGRDPRGARFKAYYRRADDQPRAFFAGTGDRWLWPGAACRLGARLLLFLLEVELDRTSHGPFAFRVTGSRALLIDNPHAPPTHWRLRPLTVPETAWGVRLGSGAALVLGEHLYAFSVIEPGNHDVYLARWPLARVARGSLDDPRWYDGRRWVDGRRFADAPRPIFSGGQTELSVHHDAARDRLLAVYTAGLTRATIVMRSAPAPTGPWTAPRTIFVPPESGRPDTWVYAAKAHPQLADDDALPLTYVTNHRDLKRLLRDTSLYYPRFVRLTMPAH